MLKPWLWTMNMYTTSEYGVFKWFSLTSDKGFHHQSMFDFTNEKAIRISSLNHRWTNILMWWKVCILEINTCLLCKIFWRQRWHWASADYCITFYLTTHLQHVIIGSPWRVDFLLGTRNDVHGSLWNKTLYIQEVYKENQMYVYKWHGI